VQTKGVTQMRKYSQITLEERDKIYLYIKNNKSLSEIARLIGRSTSTISREIRRNSCSLGYLPDRAHSCFENRKAIKSSKLDKYPLLKKYVLTKLKEDKWSPEAIAGRLKHHEQIGTISHESIYKFIYSPEGNKMKLYQHLMYRRPARQLHHSRVKRLLTGAEHHIANRPEIANNRLEFGHFEGDLTFMKGSNSSNLITMIERKTRKILIAKNDNKSAIGTICNITGKLKSLPQGLVKSMTFDNGGEFRRFANLGLMGVKVYFCNPHSPWEKGSIERLHVSLHKYIPKKSDIRQVTKEMILEAENKLNNLPRKVLNFLTPNEAWDINNSQTVALAD
jgi:IS30 family transposase